MPTSMHSHERYANNRVEVSYEQTRARERDNSAYSRLKKIPCRFKEQAKASYTGEKCGLACISHQGAGATLILDYMQLLTQHLPDKP